MTDMLASENITRCLAQLQTGDDDAFVSIWHYYYPLISNVARRSLMGMARQTVDASDIAQSALASFLVGVNREAFPRLFDSDDLRRLLLTIALNKVREACRREERRAALLREKYRHVAPNSNPPEPDADVGMSEEIERLLNALEPNMLRPIAIAKWNGLTNEQIAQSIGRSISTVELKLKLIRRIWSELHRK